jgi:hypothetical protein
MRKVVAVGVETSALVLVLVVGAEVAKVVAEVAEAAVPMGMGVLMVVTTMVMTAEAAMVVVAMVVVVLGNIASPRSDHHHQCRQQSYTPTEFVHSPYIGRKGTG